MGFAKTCARALKALWSGGSGAHGAKGGPSGRPPSGAGAASGRAGEDGGARCGETGPKPLGPTQWETTPGAQGPRSGGGAGASGPPGLAAAGGTGLRRHSGGRDGDQRHGAADGRGADFPCADDAGPRANPVPRRLKNVPIKGPKEGGWRLGSEWPRVEGLRGGRDPSRWQRGPRAGKGGRPYQPEAPPAGDPAGRPGTQPNIEKQLAARGGAGQLGARRNRRSASAGARLDGGDLRRGVAPKEPGARSGRSTAPVLGPPPRKMMSRANGAPPSAGDDPGQRAGRGTGARSRGRAGSADAGRRADPAVDGGGSSSRSEPRRRGDRGPVWDRLSRSASEYWGRPQGGGGPAPTLRDRRSLGRGEPAVESAPPQWRSSRSMSAPGLAPMPAARAGGGRERTRSRGRRRALPERAKSAEPTTAEANNRASFEFPKAKPDHRRRRAKSGSFVRNSCDASDGGLPPRPSSRSRASTEAGGGGMKSLPEGKQGVGDGDRAKGGEGKENRSAAMNGGGPEKSDPVCEEAGRLSPDSPDRLDALLCAGSAHGSRGGSVGSHKPDWSFKCSGVTRSAGPKLEKVREDVGESGSSHGRRITSRQPITEGRVSVRGSCTLNKEPTGICSRGGEEHSLYEKPHTAVGEEQSYVRHRVSDQEIVAEPANVAHSTTDETNTTMLDRKSIASSTGTGQTTSAQETSRSSSASVSGQEGRQKRFGNIEVMLCTPDGTTQGRGSVVLPVDMPTTQAMVPSGSPTTLPASGTEGMKRPLDFPRSRPSSEKQPLRLTNGKAAEGAPPKSPPLKLLQNFALPDGSAGNGVVLLEEKALDVLEITGQLLQLAKEKLPVAVQKESLNKKTADAMESKLDVEAPKGSPSLSTVSSDHASGSSIHVGKEVQANYSEGSVSIPAKEGTSAGHGVGVSDVQELAGTSASRHLLDTTGDDVAGQAPGLQPSHPMADLAREESREVPKPDFDDAIKVGVCVEDDDDGTASEAASSEPVVPVAPQGCPYWPRPNAERPSEHARSEGLEVSNRAASRTVPNSPSTGCNNVKAIPPVHLGARVQDWVIPHPEGDDTQLSTIKAVAGPAPKQEGERPAGESEKPSEVWAGSIAATQGSVPSASHAQEPSPGQKSDAADQATPQPISAPQARSQSSASSSLGSTATACSVGVQSSPRQQGAAADAKGDASQTEWPRVYTVQATPGDGKVAAASTTTIDDDFEFDPPSPRHPEMLKVAGGYEVWSFNPMWQEERRTPTPSIGDPCACPGARRPRGT
eukprot:evm.model.scf_2952.2 EVM.evm.TU.scf_2952.2   scf_2952:7922-11803(-)